MKPVIIYIFLQICVKVYFLQSHIKVYLNDPPKAFCYFFLFLLFPNGHCLKRSGHIITLKEPRMTRMLILDQVNTFIYCPCVNLLCSLYVSS